jgi:hypothetical protein
MLIKAPSFASANPSSGLLDGLGTYRMNCVASTAQSEST